ncbi:hypothetical protein [Neisseria montereyensis]|uniref:Uncharacterized protein n=1 Tax=Neisseria montereyensis TaxID=2973938 RepID=A0ABT2FBJ7_9NEIS|nr:hypothetical protein [Neisseria montereyensis]MCS4532893.1 hypothetical protein [Neisseria montereyensis]
MPKPDNRGCILAIAQSKQRADMQSAPTLADMSRVKQSPPETNAFYRLIYPY